MSGTITINSSELLNAMKPQLLQMPEITRQPYSYVIYTDGSKYYAKNGSTGQVDFSSSDASTVIQNAINQIEGSGGKIFVRSGRYVISSTVTVKPYIDIEFERNAVRISSTVSPAFILTGSSPIHFIKVSGGYFGSSTQGTEIFRVTGQGNFVLKDMNFYGDYAIQREILPIRVVVSDNFFHVKISNMHAYTKYFIRIEKDPGKFVSRQSVAIDRITWYNDIPTDAVMIDIYANAYALYYISASNIYGYYYGTGVRMTTEGTGNIYFCRFSNMFLETNNGIYMNATGGEIADIFFSNVFIYPRVTNSYGFYAAGKIHSIGANQLTIQFTRDSGITGIALLPTEQTYTRGGYFKFTNLRLYDVNVPSDVGQRSIVTNNYVHDSVFTGTQLYLNYAQIQGSNVRVITPFSVRSGKATFSGDGSTTQFKISHGLIATPSKILVTPGSNDARGAFHVTADATYIYVNYATAPPTGTNNVVLYWYAEV